ncbi:hypothetical protein F4861DRAFT_544446 [Xylaria intraflava]|nr:hypothetical protein F4861DRAFT_544446 [Xylaria intraflava]
MYKVLNADPPSSDADCARIRSAVREALEIFSGDNEYSGTATDHAEPRRSARKK